MVIYRGGELVGTRFIGRIGAGMPLPHTYRGRDAPPTRIGAGMPLPHIGAGMPLPHVISIG